MKVVPLLAGLSVALPLVACRGNFDNMPVEDGGMDAPPEPPLSELACSRRIFKLDAAISGDVDLAITSRVENNAWVYLVGWTDPADGSVTAAQLDQSYLMVGSPRRLVTQGAAGLAGFEVRPTRVWMVTVSGAQQTLWDLSADLSSVKAVVTETSVAAFEPIASDLIRPREWPVWARGVDKALRLSALKDDGTVGATYTTTEPYAAPVQHVSIADFEGHVHVAWQLTNGECYNSDVDFVNDQMPPTPTGNTFLGGQCRAVRAISGVPLHDSMVTVWPSIAGDIVAMWTGPLPPPEDFAAFNVNLAKGRAPKVAFDGSLYWVAWRDDKKLWVAHIDREGVFRMAEIPGVLPAGDEAFELVQRSADVALAVHTGAALKIYSLCAGKP